MDKTQIVHRRVLEVLAEQFEARKAGRTGEGKLRILFDFEDLLRDAGAAEGMSRKQATEQLERAERFGWLRRIGHRFEPHWIQQLEMLPEGEYGLFAALETPSPRERRLGWSELFLRFAEAAVPERFRISWNSWCRALAADAAVGTVRLPFRWKELESGEELMHVLLGALSWPGESLIRFASCVLCGDSKRLESLAPRLNDALRQLSSGQLNSLEDLGLLRIPRVVLVHGPLLLELPHGQMDLGLLAGPVWISETDIRLATSTRTSAKRVLFVENETTMQELAKLRSGVLLVHTSYPSSAVLELAKCLPEDAEYWHFGDSDPAGFDILRVLRERTAKQIKPLHMIFRPKVGAPSLTPEDRQILARVRGLPLMADIQDELVRIEEAGSKGDFEQEALGWPTREWPFYT